LITPEFKICTTGIF